MKKGLKRIARILFKGLFLVRIVGGENLPKEGGMILAPNHPSNWDPLIVYAYSEREIFFLAKESLFQTFIGNKIMRYFGAFPVSRSGKNAKEVYAEGVQLLKKGNVVGIFPEGKRCHEIDVDKGKTGAVRMAKETGCPIIPVAIVGSYRWFRPITLVIGEGIYIDQSEHVKESTKQVLCAIRNLKEQHQKRP